MPVRAPIPRIISHSSDPAKRTRLHSLRITTHSTRISGAKTRKMNPASRVKSGRKSSTMRRITAENGPSITNAVSDRMPNVRSRRVRRTQPAFTFAERRSIRCMVAVSVRMIGPTMEISGTRSGVSKSTFQKP